MTTDLPHILVVDDDERLSELLRRFLNDNGLRVTLARDATTARAKLAGFHFDLLVLDIMMPGEDGLELTKALRRTTDVPILLLTARGEPDDRIAGLEAGADDYLAKPFDPRELVLRISSILRRVPKEPDPPYELRLGRWTWRPDRDELVSGDEAVRLTQAEATLLKVLAASMGTPLSRETLVHEGSAGNARSVDVQVTRLRRKLETDPRTPRLLVTVRGEGYMLRPEG